MVVILDRSQNFVKLNGKRRKFVALFLFLEVKPNNLKMKKVAILSFIVLFSINFLWAQKDQRIIQDLQVDVVYLASDLLQGRETGTPGEAMAAAYIAARFEELGLSPKGENESWFQPFPFKEMTNPHAADGGQGREGTGKNVVAFLDNGAASTVVIGGHYDHLGMGGSGSRTPGESAIHNGADDNASGIAALLRIARHLKESELKNNNYLFIAFSGEEMGLFGSKHFAGNPTTDLASVNYMLNMDMVGRLNEEKVLAINGVGTSPVWKKVLERISVGGITIKTSDSGVGPSDHTSFYLKDIPVLHFFTGQHSDYHKPADDAHLVNYDGLYDVSSFIIALIESLDPKGKLEFSKTKDNQDRQVARFKVTLGVMPDYVHNGDGMRIDSVLDGKPAHAAGLKDGDVITKIGDTEVTDIYSYMEGLSKFKKGDTTRVIVLRGNKKISKKVTF